MKLRALIFDYNGVIADDEHVHFELFGEILREQARIVGKNVILSKTDYERKYLSKDDKGFFSSALRDYGLPTSAEIVKHLVDEKKEMYIERQDSIKPFPGVTELIKAVAKDGILLAIVSGALRSEIEHFLERMGVLQDFSVIISAEDVKESKPNPEGFLKALDKLSEIANEGILPAESVIVIEDSVDGIKAAKRAGMRCLAVANSYDLSELSFADFVVETLDGMDLNSLKELCEHRF